MSVYIMTSPFSIPSSDPATSDPLDVQPTLGLRRSRPLVALKVALKVTLESSLSAVNCRLCPLHFSRRVIRRDSRAVTALVRQGAQ